jgi:hypothetical protein
MCLSIGRAIHLAAGLCLAVVFQISGCDQAVDLKNKLTSLSSAKGASGASAGKYPVNAETERILGVTVELAEDEATRAAVRQSHGDWLKLRGSHCGAMEKLEKEGATNTAGNCYAALDKQRRDALNQIRVALLLGKAAPPTVAAADINASIAFEAGRYQNKVVVAPGGTVAAVSSPTGEIDVYDLITGQRLRSFNTERQAARVEFSKNGRLILIGKQQSRGVKVYDLYGGDELKEINEILGPYVSVDDGRLLVYADNAALGIYDVANGKTLATGFFAKSSINALAVDPATKNVAASTRDGWISLWQVVPVGNGGGMTVKALTEAKLYANNQYVQEMDFLENGRFLFVVVTGIPSGGDLDLITVPELQRTRTASSPGVYLHGLSRIPGTNKVALLSNKSSGQGTVLAMLDMPAGTGLVLDESRPFLSVAPVGDIKRKLLFVNSQGMWTRDLPQSAEEPIQDVITRVASIVAPPASTRVAVPNIPAVRTVQPNARVEGVGVYEGVLPGGRKRGFQEHVAGTVVVTVGSQRAPLVLVLSSYEPVNWVVRSGGARITHVLMSGSDQSNVTGVVGAEVTRIGTANGYGDGTPGRSGRSHGGTGALNASVMKYLGRGMDRFQGSYTGSSFSIGTQSTGGVIGIQKSFDSQGKPYYGDRPPQ